MNDKKYGIFSNFLYVLRIASKSNKKLIIITLMGGVVDLISIFWGMYSLKFIVAVIEKDMGIKTLVAVVLSVCSAMLILSVISRLYWSLFEYEYIRMNIYLQKKRMEKVYTTDYKNMESPLFLDYIQRTKAALYNNNGFQGVLTQTKNMIAQGSMTVIAAIMIGRKNISVVITITVMSVGMAKILSWVTQRDKVKYSDVMTPTLRKIGYLDNTSRNFDFAKDIRLFNMSRVFKQEYSKVNSIFINMNKGHHNRWILCNLSMQFILLIETTIMYVWLVYLVMYKGMAVADFVLYIALVTSYYKAIGYILWIYSNIKGNCLMVNDYRNFMNWTEDADNYSETDGKRHDANLTKYEFVFDNVSFKYPGNDNYVLKNINITISNGMNLAIVGTNGAGKTTFIKLIMRLYEPTEGRILLNGIDIKEYNRDEYYKFFSPVFQNTECFAIPIYKNISIRDEEETDMERTKEALVKSGLWEKIKSYEAGMKTSMLKIFDEKGIDLSGGERQRLAMARALYKGGNVVILDEPTAALDALAEDRIYREFDDIVGDKTSIFISHRLGSTKFCDRIAMFENGCIIEEGTHEELMELNGKYAYMFDIQAQYYKEENGDE